MMQEETWMTGDKAAQYFNIEVEDSAMAVACVSSYFNRYKNTPEYLRKKDKPHSKVQDNLENEKESILEDLYLYGI